jgi:hypothetical protein
MDHRVAALHAFVQTSAFRYVAGHQLNPILRELFCLLPIADQSAHYVPFR